MEFIEKIDKEIANLYDANDKLIDIIAFAGRDSETKYNQEYWDIVDGAEALRKALQKALDNHSNVVLDLHEWLNPTSINTPFKPTNFEKYAENIFMGTG